MESPSLMDMMDKLYADMEKHIGIDRVEGSLVHYKQARTTLGKFVEAKFKTKDVAFGQLTNQFIFRLLRVPRHRLRLHVKLNEKVSCHIKEGLPFGLQRRLCGQTFLC